MGELTKRDKCLTKISDILKSKQDSILSVIPQHLTVSRLSTVFMSACRKNEKLLECSAVSLVKSFMDAGEVGLEPDGINAHLIPYGKECTYMVDYKGFIKLAKLSGEVADMTANVVYSKDVFSHEYGSNKHLKHIKHLDGDRGERIAAYSYVKYKDDSEDFRVLTASEVEHAKRSSKTDKIWKSDPDPMWAKTAVRQHAKFLCGPKQVALQSAANLDEKLELKDIDITDVTGKATEDKKELLKQKIKSKKDNGKKKDDKKEDKKSEKEEPKAEEPKAEEQKVETPQEKFERQMGEFQAKIDQDDKYFKELGELGFTTAAEITDKKAQKDVIEYFEILTG